MTGFALEILKKNKDRMNQVALIDRNGTRKITWESLLDNVLRVAAYARKKCLKGVVPVFMERGMEVTASILGLNLAGVGVAPVSLNTPISRCDNIAGQTKNSIWITDTYNEAISYAPAYEMLSEGMEADPAYVVFTSGTSGNPKGVMLTNNAMMGGIRRAAGSDFFNLKNSDRMLQNSSLSFIAVVADLFSPLYAGSAVYFLPEDGRDDTHVIVDFINTHEITSLFMSPQMYDIFEGAPSLKCVCIGGDRIKNIGPKGHRLVGVYGMTEVAGFAFHFDIIKPENKALIGKPCEGICAYIIDENGNETSEGELCVSGPVAYAYLGLEDQNKTVFTSNPFSDNEDYSVLLHTRDKVKKLPDGSYLFIDRMDNMIKVNGQRVEPGEIESVLMEYPGVDDVAVRDFTDENQQSMICAYYISHSGSDEGRMIKYLSDRLPQYMVPSALVRLDKMPVNANGKIDRTALKKPDFSEFLSDYEKPVGQKEKLLCLAFEKILKLKKVGRNDDFFKLGGDSLTALSLVNECELLGISTGDVFVGKTPKSIALLAARKADAFYEGLSEDTERTKLTDSQMNIILDCSLDEKCTKYINPVLFSFDRADNMNCENIKKAVDSVIRNHPALYSTITAEKGELYMLRQDFPENGICEAVECKWTENLVGNLVEPIAPGKDLLCIARAFLDCNKVHVFFNIHHVVSDGRSVAVLAKELQNVLSGREIMTERVNAFALYDAECRIKASETRKRAEKYFEHLLSDADIDSNLIPDYPAAKATGTAAEYYNISIPLSGIQQYASENGFTENTFFMGVYGYVLAKMTGQSESLFCTAESGRNSSLLNNTVSMFVKTVPVLLKIDEEKTGKELLSGLQAQFFATLRNDCVGFTDLAREYGIRPDVMFVYHSDMLNGSEASASGETEVKIEILETGEFISNLSFMIFRLKDKYNLRIEYRPDLYEKYTIERFVGLFRKTIDAFISDNPLKCMELISNEDRAFLDNENARTIREPYEETILDMFRETVRKYPEKAAVCSDGKTYSYSQVDFLSDKIAAFLEKRGIGRGNVVSVLIPRSEYMLIASIGIIKTGAAYQPLDPSYPEERLSFMTTDANVSLVIKDRKFDFLLKDYKGEILYTDEIESLPAEAPGRADISKDDIMVLLYTSGTTGTPKGVMIAHENISAFVHAHVVSRYLDSDSIVAQYASYGFDAHLADLYPTLYMGCTLHIIPDAIRLDLAGIKDFCLENHVTHLCMTTQVARQFAIAYPKLDCMKIVDAGGEKLVSFNIPETYMFVNLYGPTEGTVCFTRFELDRFYDNIPIGKALDGNILYVVDTFGRRVPVGVPGELIQCGQQVGAGYLGRPDLTEKVFVPNTFEENPGKGYGRCYKTGDIVRFINDGNIEYIGRRDHQVKIRGFRIELGEVEKAIQDFPGIDAVTVTVSEKGSVKNLCAYVVSDSKVDIEALCTFIGKSHPSYMVPSVVMQIDRIPLNVNGKVDKRKLPEPEMHFENVKKPENDLQKQIFDCVADAAGTTEFGIETDIFMAGLTSIGSIRLCSLLADRFEVPFKIRDLKRFKTVKSIEEYLRREKGIFSSLDSDTNDDILTAKQLSAETEYGPSYSVTKTMEGIFTECLQHPGSTIYNIPYLIKLEKGIDELKLKKAIVCAVEAHPYMKAELFTDSEGNICQHRRLNDIYKEDDIKQICFDSPDQINDSLVTPFNLTGSRLFEISLIHADGLYLFVNIHHIISDGTSMSVFIKDVEKAYSGEILQEEKYSGFDVAYEEKQSRTNEELKTEKEYYSSLLDEYDKDFLLIPDKIADDPSDSGIIRMSGKEADALQIKQFCEKNRLSMNAYFVGAFGMVLAKYAGMDYSVFNTVYNGRNDSRLKNTVAMLVKTLPVVCNTENETVTELVSEMSSQLMDSMSNDLYSYAEISRNFGIKNDVMFIYQGDSFTNDSFCGVKSEQIVLGLSEAKASMTLQVMIYGDRLEYEFEYDPKKYTNAMAEAFVLAFDQVAASFTKVEKLKDVSLLSEKQEAKIEKHNETETDYDRTKTINDFFADAVRNNPDELCVEYKGRKYSYGEINELTSKLAYFLMQKGIGRGDIVSILINRDENMVIGAHGVIRTGAAYLGLDPTYPPERLDFMIQDSGSKYLIADRSLMSVLSNYCGNVIFTDEISELKTPSPEETEAFISKEEHMVSSEDTSLIVYSSGTTGLPKGSILRHRNIVCFYHNYTADSDIRTGSRVATYASFGFDGGAMDVFCVPMAGASLYIIPDEIRLDLSRLEQFFVKNGITTGFMTTQVGCMFIASTKCRTLKRFVVGGEKFIPVTGPSWTVFDNGYGPSECMCYVNRYHVKNTGSLQPIGIVSRDTKEYIIDKFGNRLPYGACGELCIAGGQVGKGYLNRPEKTQEAFVLNPFSENPEYSVMYRTGDIVRMLPDGNYDFIGRRDGQVKIRGFRIELSEVEQQIRRYPGITNATVRAYNNPSGGKYMAAYIVMDEKLDDDALKKFIGKDKPEYMIPTVIMQVNEIPLTSNGKVDASKLPEPKLGALKKGAEPASEIEEIICGIFGEVIGTDKVYADDDFFSIGGSSISAIQVVVKCEQAGFPIVYKNLFANPTPQKLAAFISGERVKDVTASDLNRNNEYDDSAIKYNVISNLPYIKNNGVGDVLLTGVTGFLGSHIFRELMESTSGIITCLVRSKEGLPSDIRFEAMMTYYFEDWYTDEMRPRTVIIDAGLEDDNLLEKLEKCHYDTIINCAANVKHFAVENELLSSNYSGVENLIELAEKSDAKLVQISSLSVCGESVNGSVPNDYIFKESDLNVGQSLENKYIYSKYLGEQAVIDAVSKKRIRGKVMRLGNLMARIDDSQFQLNAGQNGFLRMFLGFKRLGCFPIDMLDAEIEFSPIDQVARAVVLLSGTPDQFTVFHAKNCNTIHYGYLLKAIQEVGYPIEIVENDEFETRLQKAIQNTSEAEDLGGLLAYRNSTTGSLTDVTRHSGDDNTCEKTETRIKLSSSTTFTTKALYRLGFAWPLVNMDYLNKMVEILENLDFFDI